MQLYFSPLACSMASKILAEEAAFNIEFVEVDPHTKRVLATAEDYLAIYPLGMVPALRTDDGTFLTENGAILQYLADAVPNAKLAPPASDRMARARLQQWLSFFGTELHKGLFIPLLDPTAASETKAWAVKKGRAKLVYLDEYMRGRDFVLDRFSVADAYLATVLNWTQATPQIDMADYPALRDYLSAMRKRPSIAKVLGEEVPLFQAEMARRKAA